MFLSVIVALAVMPAPPSAGGERLQPCRVHVYSAPVEPLSDEERRGLADSTRDIVEAIGRRPTDFVLVDSADAAEVVVEVVSREERNVAEGGFGGASVTRFRETIVRLRVKSGERQSDLKGIGRPSWKSAAKDAVERLARWTRNRQKETAGVSAGRSVG